MRKIVQEYTVVVTEYLVDVEEGEDPVLKVQQQSPMSIEINVIPSFVKILKYKIRTPVKEDLVDADYLMAESELDFNCDSEYSDEKYIDSLMKDLYDE